MMGKHRGDGFDLQYYSKYLLKMKRLQDLYYLLSNQNTVASLETMGVHQKSSGY